MLESSHPCPICGHVAKLTRKSLGGYRIQCCPKCSLRYAGEAFDVDVDYSSVYKMDEYQADHIDNLLNTPDKSVFAKIATFAPFFTQVQHHPGYRLLDIGCGVGRFCHAATSQGWDVHGIDISERAITVGQSYANFPMECLSLEDCVARGDRYDVVTSFEVLEHLIDPAHFLTLITRLLRPGGTLFGTVPNWHNHRVQRATRPDWVPPIHLLFYTQQALLTLAETVGLQQVRIGAIPNESQPTNWMQHMRWRWRQIRGRGNPLGLWMCAQWPGDND